MDPHGIFTWEGSLPIKGGPALVSQEEGHLNFIFNLDILLVSVPFCLITKVEVQWMFNMTQTDYFIA